MDPAGRREIMVPKKPARMIDPGGFLIFWHRNERPGTRSGQVF